MKSAAAARATSARALCISAMFLSLSACGGGDSVVGTGDGDQDPLALAEGPAQVPYGAREWLIFVVADLEPRQRTLIEDTLSEMPQFVAEWTYCDAECSLEDARVVLGADPEVLAELHVDNIPTVYKAMPAESVDDELMAAMVPLLREFPGVMNVQVGPRVIALDGGS